METPEVRVQGVSGAAPISNTLSSGDDGVVDNLGNHTATTTLTMGGNNIANAGNIVATGSIQAGESDSTCSTSADYGKIRYDSATNRAYLCKQ